MPRKGKGRNVPKGNRRARHESICKFWKGALESARQAKASYDEIGEEVTGFFKAKHDSLFKDPMVQKNFMDFRNAIAISVPKVAQAKNTLGPNLYPVNPQRVVTPNTDSPVMMALARVLQEYLNYTARETGLQRQIRKNIDDSLLRGRGFMRIVWDDVMEVVTSEYLSSRDVLVDPDVDDIQKAQWIAIRETKPLWKLKREVEEFNKKDSWRIKDLKERRRSLTEGFRSEDRSAPSNYNVEVWRIYSKMGCGIRGFGFEEGYEGYKDDEDFLVIGIAEEATVPIYEQGWDVPLHLDKEWPVIPIDYIETTDELWPVSVMGQVMPLQKGMDLITSMQLSSAKQRGRFILLGDSTVDRKYQERIRNGGTSEYIPVDLKQGESLRQKFEVLNMGQISAELRMEREFYEREIETTTGVTPVVTGMHGGSQERSASASNLKGQAAGVRLSDLRQRTEEQQATAARCEAIYAKLELDAEEVSPYVRQSKIGMYWVKIELPGGAVIALRPPEDDLAEEGVEEDPMRPLTLMEIAPMAATFYSSMEEAGQAAMDVWEAVKQASEPRLMGLRQILGNGQMMDDGQGGQVEIPPKRLSPAPVTVEDVWRETASMTGVQVARELGYKLATGSMAMLDPGRLQDLVETMVNQMGPVAMQAGDLQTFNQLLAWWQDVFEIPEDKRVGPIMPPQMPPEGAPAEGGE